jgi:SsrA-binding protein
LRKVIVTNRKARKEYEIVETFEAGLALAGAEVKSIRAGKVSLQEAYVRPEAGELYVVGMHVTPYEQATVDAPEPRRKRKLLMRKREIRRLTRAVEQKGVTIVPLSLYFTHGRAKLEVAVCRGKRKYDKRAEMREEEDRHAAEQAQRGGKDFE